MANLRPRSIANSPTESTKNEWRPVVKRGPRYPKPDDNSDLVYIRNHPESDEYRQRYSGPGGLQRAIHDAAILDDLPGFRAAVAQVIPDPSKRNREGFRQLHMDPLGYAAPQGAVRVVEQLKQWDPSMFGPEAIYLDSLLGQTVYHWFRASHRDRIAHEDDPGGYEPDKSIAKGHQGVINILLEAGAKPKRGALGNIEMDNVASITPSAEVLDVAEKFLRAGLSINSERSDLPSPFASAAAQQNLELIKLMMQYQRPSQASLDMALALTPMIQANPLIQFLLDNGANINAEIKGRESFDPLYEAATRYVTFHEDQLIHLLIQHKANPNRGPPGFNNSALTRVLRYPELAIALLDLGADANWYDSLGDSVLHWATSQSFGLDPAARAKIVSALLAHGAYPNPKNKAGVTPLMQLTADEAPSIDLLVAAGADVNITKKDYFLNTASSKAQLSSFEIGPIDWAILAHNDPLAAALVTRNKHLDESDCGAVYYAAEIGAAKTLGALLDAGANSHLVSVEGKWTRTPLQIAAEGGQAAAVKVLLDRHAADINETTPRIAMSLPEIALAARSGQLIVSTGGETALILASQHGHAEVVAEILRHGADANLRDYTGFSALKSARLAVRQGVDGAQEVERILVEHGARE